MSDNNLELDIKEVEEVVDLNDPEPVVSEPVVSEPAVPEPAVDAYSENIELTKEQEERLQNWINEETDSEKEFKKLSEFNNALQQTLKEKYETKKIDETFSNLTGRINNITKNKISNEKKRVIYNKKKQRRSLRTSQFSMKLF